MEHPKQQPPVGAGKPETGETAPVRLPTDPAALEGGRVFLLTQSGERIELEDTEACRKSLDRYFSAKLKGLRDRQEPPS